MLSSFTNMRNQAAQAGNRAAILDRLNIIGMSQNCINRVMDAVNNMKNSDHIKGALNFLTEATATKSIREVYYTHSDYIAEYFCTISNLGLFAVAFYYNDYATLLAATFSALSHAIPSQRLHDLDLLGVFLILGKAATNYQMLLKRPDVIAWGAGAIAINLIDTHVTRKHLDKVGPWIHVAWHLAAAFALYKFNAAQLEVTAAEIQSISTIECLTNPPSFLVNAYNTIGDYFGKLSTKGRCTLM